jgi:hypothetical protein
MPGRTGRERAWERVGRGPGVPRQAARQQGNTNGETAVDGVVPGRRPTIGRGVVCGWTREETGERARVLCQEPASHTASDGCLCPWGG